MAKEGIAFNKMISLCQLEERHGVDLEQGYKNDLACSTFVDYITQDMRKNLCDISQAANFLAYRWMVLLTLLIWKKREGEFSQIGNGILTVWCLAHRFELLMHFGIHFSTLLNIF